MMSNHDTAYLKASLINLPFIVIIALLLDSWWQIMLLSFVVSLVVQGVALWWMGVLGCT